jgi:protein transport protein SEC39
VAEEAAREDAWDAAGDLQSPAMPGGFGTPRLAPPEKVTTVMSATAKEDAPMSLFDLSRAATRAASRNFIALPNLQGLGDVKTRGEGEPKPDQPRVRKRDQIRDAAVGTLVSGVGWLVGAQPVDRSRDA